MGSICHVVEYLKKKNKLKNDLNLCNKQDHVSVEVKYSFFKCLLYLSPKYKTYKYFDLSHRDPKVCNFPDKIIQGASEWTDGPRTLQFFLTDYEGHA